MKKIGTPRTAQSRNGRTAKPSNSPAKIQPINLPEEDRLLLDRQDWIGYEYLRARRVRAKRDATERDVEFLAEHDAVEAQIQRDPDAVLESARKALDENTTLILKLIRSKRFFQDLKEYSRDQAADCFTSKANYLNEQLIRLAEDRTPGACRALWYQAMQLAEAVVRIAAASPEDFRSMAESSLTMPSLRARNPKFSCDAERIAKAIHLGEKHAAPDIHDNRSRIGALCHFLVAKQVEHVEWTRREREHLEWSAKHVHHTEDPIPSYYHPNVRRHYEESWKLPELRGNADTWWKARVREMVRDEFVRIKRFPLRNPGLWQELAKVTDNGTENAKWRALEKYCLNKIRQIAGQGSASV